MFMRVAKMITKRNSKAALLILCPALLGGCATLPGVSDVNQKVVDEQAPIAAKLNSIGKGIQPVSDLVTYHSTPYIGGEKKDSITTLPAAFTRRDFRLERHGKKTLEEISSAVSSITGYQVVMDSTITSKGSGMVAGVQSSGGAATESAPSASGLVIPPLPSEASTVGSRNSKTMTVDYLGSLAGFLDSVSAHFGIHWKTVGNKILLSRFDIRQFNIAALPIQSTLTSSLSGSGVSGVSSSSSSGGSSSGTASSGGSSSGGTGSAGGTTSSVSTNSKIDLWVGIKASLNALVAGNGSVTIDSNTGDVLVSTTPERMAKVESYISGLNSSLAKRLAIDITVLSVSIKKTDDYSLQWNTLLQNLSGNFSLALSGGANPVSGATSLAYNILRPNDNVQSASAIVSALSQQVKILNTYHVPVLTSNNIPVPVSQTQRQSYVAGSSIVSTANVGSEVSTQVGTITTGISMTILPRIRPDNSILLSMSMNLSTLNGIQTINSGTQTIQLPSVSSQDFIEQIQAHSGDSIVLSGFDGVLLSATKSGTVTPDNWLLGGGQNGQNSHQMLVVIVTPKLIN